MCHCVFIKFAYFLIVLLFWYLDVLCTNLSQFTLLLLLFVFYFNFHLPNQCMKMCGHVCCTTLTHTPLSVSFHMRNSMSKTFIDLTFNVWSCWRLFNKACIFLHFFLIQKHFCFNSECPMYIFSTVIVQ